MQDSEVCLLEQGIVCAGSATRSGCGVRCPDSGMPCRGCYGPTPDVVDQGAKLVSAVASIIDSKESEEIDGSWPTCPTSWGTPTASVSRPPSCKGASDMAGPIKIDPITRLEGHGKIEIFLDDDGGVKTATSRSPSCAASSASSSAGRSRSCRAS